MIDLFFHKFASLYNFTGSYFIIGGDLNTVLKLEIHRSGITSGKCHSSNKTTYGGVKAGAK